MAPSRSWRADAGGSADEQRHRSGTAGKSRHGWERSGSMGNNSVSVEAVGKGGAASGPASASFRCDSEHSGCCSAAVLCGLDPGSASSDANELKPNVAADPNELKPNVASDSGQAVPPPPQVNEIQTGGSGQAAAGDAERCGFVVDTRPSDDSIVFFQQT